MSQDQQGFTFDSVEQFAQVVQGLIARDRRQNAPASKSTGGGQTDTTVDQSESVPGKAVDYGSFAHIEYVPAPVSTSGRKDNPDGGTTTLEIFSARVIGWTANRGSSYAEDTKTVMLGTDAFSGTFGSSWATQFVS